MHKSAQRNDKNGRNAIDSKRLFYVKSLIHIRIHYNIENYKVNSKQCDYHALKGPELHYLPNTLCSILAKISFECRHKTNISLNLSVTCNGWGKECTEVCSSR